MEKNLNALKKELFDLGTKINECFDFDNEKSQTIFLYGLKLKRYLNNDTYSVKDMDGDKQYHEQSNYCILNALIMDFRKRARLKKENPDLKMGRYQEIVILDQELEQDFEHTITIGMSYDPKMNQE